MLTSSVYAWVVLLMLRQKKMHDLSPFSPAAALHIGPEIRILLRNYIVEANHSTLRIVGYHFASRLTATLNLCPIYLKLLEHML